MAAILFGSISVVVDTSELQRRAFNESFAAHGLDWLWSHDQYVAMLDSNGGAQRIADYATARGADVDAAEVHATKSAIFQELLGTSPRGPPRRHRHDRRSQAQRHKLGFVTTTSRANVDALLTALAPDISAQTFDLIVSRDAVKDPKPDPAVYAFALDQLGENAAHAVAIEDNVGGVAAATAAGVRCIAFPNENTVGGDFSAAAETVDALEPGRVLGLATA